MFEALIGQIYLVTVVSVIVSNLALSRAAAPPGATMTPRPGWLEDLDRVDAALYGAVANTPTPSLDDAMRRLSDAANYSRLSLTAAALLPRSAARAAAALRVRSRVPRRDGGDRKRRAQTARQPPPAGPPGEEVPADRHVRMPVTRSFPSGHTAAAVAFAAGVGRVMPGAGAPLYGLAAARRLLPGPHRRSLPR